METVLITGGTGLVGNALTSALLKKGYQVIILSRKKKEVAAASDKTQPSVEYAVWNVKDKTINLAALQRADHIIHLAGAGVIDKKWTDAYKKEIIDSRTKSSEFIIETLKNNTNKVKTIVSASAIGWYVPDAEDPSLVPHTEDQSADTSFLGEVCRLWEAGIEPVTELGKRLVKFRIGIVLSNDGGALKEFKTPLKFGVAAILGNGEQIVSWIHIDDLCSLFIYAIQKNQLSGSYNAVAPFPVSNKELTLTLARQYNPKFFIPMHVPSFVLKIMLGGRSLEILKSNTVSDAKISGAGFDFSFKTIESALKNLCNAK